jgi:AcrR family transcriptional regulator
LAAHSVGQISPAASTLLRNEPVQARSTARLTALLDAAAQVIDQIGYERLTTAMVAERAGASIGTVYRYFPDRIAVLQSLSARNLAQFTGRGLVDLTEGELASWTAAVDTVIDAAAAFFRSEPGFRSLRFGDIIDVRNREISAADSGPTGNGIVASLLSRVLIERFSFTDNEDLLFRLEVALEIADALLARAFAFDKSGDERFIAEAHTIAIDYLSGQYSS